MIEVVDVTQHYGVRPIFKRINMRIEPGELVTLMGPNGMGKSTLLKVLAGVLQPQKGYVEIDGLRRRRSEEEELEIRKHVVYLPDDPWLPFERSGREYLLAVGRLYGIEDDRLMDHVDRLLKLFHLEDKGDAPVRTYSKGQKKKIAVSSALVSEAPFLFLDEPFSDGLDPSGMLALKRVLGRLAARDDVTVVIATPVPEVVEEIANRICVLRDGEVIAYDTVDGLRMAAGNAENLEDALERLLRPETLESIDHYFEGFER